MKKTVPLLMLAILMIWAMTAWAEALQSKELETIISGIQKRYDSIQTLRIDFSQEFTFKGREDGLEASGRAFFKRPGMMKWEYTAPEEQQIVSNGRTLWIYQPNLNQVMVSAVPQENNIAQDFLSGMGRLKEDFAVELMEEGEGTYLLKLNPRTPQTGTTGLFMRVSKSSLMVIEIINFDLLGNSTKIKLRNVKINTPISSTIFTFEIPDGTRVMEPSLPF